METLKEMRWPVMIGKEAPDFSAGAYHQGRSKEIRLSEYRDRWALLFFYPGDFTSV